MGLVSTELSPVSLHLHFILFCIKPVYFPHYFFVHLFASVLCLLHLMCLVPSPHAFTVVVWSLLSFCVTLHFPLPTFCYQFIISPSGLGGDSESLKPSLADLPIRMNRKTPLKLMHILKIV